MKKDSTKKRAVFLTFEGISSTIFDSQVALHVREMQDNDVCFDIITFETWPGKYKESFKRLEEVKKISNTNVYLKRGVFIYIPFSEIINSVLLLISISRLKYKPDFIHARADYSAAVCNIVSAVLNIPFIWDCRGDYEAEFNEAFVANNLLKKLFKFITVRHIKFRVILAAKGCRKAIFVTKKLRERMGLGIAQTKTQVIPTSASSANFFYSESLRQETRKKLNFNPNQIVLIYSGGMVGYQNFLQYAVVFKKLLADDSKLHFLIVTPEKEKARRILSALPENNITVISSSFERMNMFYNAADFGILLRDKNRINDVASPTKFSEYCLAGLPVIMNDSVTQAFNYASMIGNLIQHTSDFSAKRLIKITKNKRNEISNKAKKYLSRESNIEKYKNIYKF